MLHMVVATHGPETCALLVHEIGDKALTALERMDEVAKGHGANMEGGWSDMSGHTIYMVIDAPNAHIVNQMMMELQFTEWNKVAIHPVVAMRDIAPAVRKRSR